jgi:hypothetical protein
MRSGHGAAALDPPQMTHLRHRLCIAASPAARLHMGRPDHIAPLFGVLGNELAIVRRRRRARKVHPSNPLRRMPREFELHRADGCPRGQGRNG